MCILTAERGSFSPQGFHYADMNTNVFGISVSALVEAFLVFFLPKNRALHLTINFIWAGHAKMCLMPYANNKGADQPDAQSDQYLCCSQPR